MTDESSLLTEEALSELSHLRQLSSMEKPPDGMRECVLVRARRTLNTGGAAPATPPRRSWLLAALVLVLVPSAFAATPIGTRWLGRLANQVSTGHVSTRPLVTRPGGRALVSPPAKPVRESPRPPPVTESPALENRNVPRHLAAVPPAEANGVGREGQLARQAGSVRAFPPMSESQADASTLHEQGTLEAESQLLRQARLLLAAEDSRAALKLAAEHRRRFPNGKLRRERVAIEQQAVEMANRAVR